MLAVAYLVIRTHIAGSVKVRGWAGLWVSESDVKCSICSPIHDYGKSMLHIHGHVGGQPSKLSNNTLSMQVLD